MTARPRRAMILGLVAALAGAAPAGADDSGLWALLRGGGHVVLMRHVLTTPGVGDPPGMRLGDCSTQRNLSEEGRRAARRIGEAFRAERVPVSLVLSSPWCRCLETARLAFGTAEVWAALGNLFGRPERRADQVREMRARIGEPVTGTVVMVSHGSTIAALADVALDSGEMVVVAPGGGGRFAVAGRLRAD